MTSAQHQLPTFDTRSLPPHHSIHQRHQTIADHLRKLDFTTANAVAHSTSHTHAHGRSTPLPHHQAFYLPSHLHRRLCLRSPHAHKTCENTSIGQHGAVHKNGTGTCRAIYSVCRGDVHLTVLIWIEQFWSLQNSHTFT